MKVYAMNVSTINPDDTKWYRNLSQKRIEKVKRYKQDKNKKQSIGAELLLRYALMKMTGETGAVEWDTEENGKLYLVNHPDIYVNLSHSGDYAVCAVNDSPIGVDIQRCNECDIDIAKRFFTEEETEYIINSKDVNTAFYEVWTKKESFVKATGTGITVPLGSFSVLDDTITYEGQVYKFSRCRLSQDGYQLFVCSRV